MEGIIFGIVDNSVLIVGAVFGLSIEKFLPKRYRNGWGAVIGAGIGNAVSDFLGGCGELNFELAVGTFLGCMIALILIPILRGLKKEI